MRAAKAAAPRAAQDCRGGVVGGGTPQGLVPRLVAAWSPAVVAAAEALVLWWEGSWWRGGPGSEVLL